jgi:hypothetical protein
MVPGTHWRCLKEEVGWILPGGKQRRMKYCDGNEELARQLPGLWHFVFTHILIPFGPVVLTWVLI